MRKNYFTILLIVFVLLSSNNASSVNYYSTANGAYASAINWIPSAPPATIPAGDTVFVMHNIVSVSNLFVTGVLDIDTLVTLSGSIKIQIDYPGYIYNRGTINTTNKFHVDGFLFNDGLLLSMNLHSDGYICNSGVIRLEPGRKFNHHGGYVECCGTIFADLIRFRTNNVVSLHEARTTCQTYCNTAETGPPTLKMGGVIATPQEAIDNIYPGRSFFSPGNVDFCNYSGLPITLVNFTAKKINNRAVQVDWSTSSENNNAYFNILRSIDGINWESIAVINGAGNSTYLINYSIADVPVGSTIYYYTIKQTDYNGKSESFGVRSVDFTSNDEQIVIYPNPSNGVFNISSNEELDLEAIVIVNMLGKNVKNCISINKQGSKRLSLDLNLLKTGVYFININSKTYKLVLE